MIVQIPCDMLFLPLLKSSDKLNSITKEECTKTIRSYLDNILESKPNAVYLNVCYRRCANDSNVFSSVLYDIEIDDNGNPVFDSNEKVIKTKINNGKKSNIYMESLFGYTVLIEKNIDIFDFATNYIKSKGSKVFMSVRMSDPHIDENMSTAFLDKNNISEYGRPDYSKECIRTYYKNYISELCQTYNIDGIELDWLRAMPVIPSNMFENCEIINNYMKEIRKITSSYGMELAVRVYSEEKQNKDIGMDVCEWVANGYIDSFTAENYYIPSNFEIPIDEWRKKISQRNKNNYPYKFYCGLDWAVSCDKKHNLCMNPALIKGFSVTCLEKGADDIYLFNMVDISDEASSEFDFSSQKTISCFNKRLEAVNNCFEGEKRFVYIKEYDDRYPIICKKSGTTIVKIYTGKTCHKISLYIGSDSDLQLNVNLNGKKMSPCGMLPEIKGFEYNDNEPFKLFYHYLGEVAKYIQIYNTIDISDVKSGYNEFEIINTTKNDISIWWIEAKTES